MRKLVGDASMEILMIPAKNVRIPMSNLWLVGKSVWLGIKAMNQESKKANWAIKWLHRRFWLHAWTPVWHEGRGPYISCGVWIIAVYRGF